MYCSSCGTQESSCIESSQQIMSGSLESLEEVTLTAADIPGAELSQPVEKHAVAALRWWLLCRGIKAPTSMKKKDLISR